MKILVTGGSGFIGTRLIGCLLAENHEVTIFDKRPSCRYPDLVMRADVRNREALCRAVVGQDAVIHLAAEHADNVSPVSLYHEVNVLGTENLVWAASQHNVQKLVFTSSVAIYSLNQPNANEQTKPCPFNPYGTSKLAAEEVLRSWSKNEADRQLVIVRPSVVFGEGNRGNVYNLLHQIQTGRFVMIGRGQNRKSMSYVGNLAGFLAHSLSFGTGEHVYNYADKPDLAMREVVDIASEMTASRLAGFRVPYSVGLAGGYCFDGLSRLTGKKYSVSSIRVRKFCADTTVNADRLKTSGYRASHDLRDALRRTIQFEFGTEPQRIHGQLRAA